MDETLRTIDGVSPTIQALLFALLGAVLGGSAVLAFRVSERQLRPPEVPEPALPPGVAAVLSVLRSSALVVDAGDSVLKASAPAVAMGLVRGHEITVRELTELVRQVRRDGQIRETELLMQREGLPPVTSPPGWLRSAPSWCWHWSRTARGSGGWSRSAATSWPT